MKILPPEPPQVPNKFCVNCHWFKQHFMGDPQCFHPMNVTLDPIYGNVKYLQTPKTLRNNPLAGCSINGNWYEPKT